MAADEIKEYGGWITTICLLIAAAVRSWIDLAKKKTETDGKIQLKKEEVAKLGRDEIMTQYNELQKEFRLVMGQLEEIQTQMIEIRSAFDVLMPFLEKAVTDNTELKNAMNKAVSKLKLNNA